MKAFKDIFFEELERQTADLEKSGVGYGRALDMASHGAYEAAQDRFSDIADHLRDMAKEGA